MTKQEMEQYIKELEDKNKKSKEALKEQEQLIYKYKCDNDWLKHQLHEQPKKICDEIRKRIKRSGGTDYDT